VVGGDDHVAREHDLEAPARAEPLTAAMRVWERPLAMPAKPPFAVAMLASHWRGLQSILPRKPSRLHRGTTTRRRRRRQLVEASESAWATAPLMAFLLGRLM